MSDRTHDDPEAAGTAALFYEAGVLRRVPRTGWGYDGIPGGETVAEHSHRAAVIGAALAAVEGADPGRTALLCVLHDLHEARTGDLTPLAKRYVAFKADPRDVTADQTAGAHPAVRDVLAGAVDEFESADSAEARCAHDADKLDCIIAALEYRAQGHTAVQGKIDRCLAALKTASARRIAEAALTTDPTSWQQLFATTSAAPR
ncbi:HD domain-containing protein [Streptacidiphilus jiangxiensis]|uniref:5'-deoxynucleotidase n=1 Tax=Streptacidiphilus jiangxiensis TaxID=235985 RepID=A0A1H8AAJ9_STRJI|nr:HD domain-containing protein [Streptacidiphilus jiangxiensis]SEM67805.1 putative hydrolases of HD superfamily [Streptacidiphilus jiangxiensis]